MAAPPWRIKARWLLAASWRQFADSAFAPIKERFGLVPLALYGLALFGVFRVGGLSGVIEELSTRAAVIWAAAATVPVFVATNLILAPLRARAAAKKKGRWQGDEFIFHSRELVHSQRLTADDHGTVTPFTIGDIPGGAYVTYEIELHPPNEYWSAILGWPHSTFDAGSRPARMGGNGGLRLTRKKQAALIAWATRPDVSSTIARVWVHSWHAGKVPL